VSDVDQYLPWLEYFMNKLEMFKSAAIFQEVEWWKVRMTINMAYVLGQRRAERYELTEAANVSFDDELLRFTELAVLFQLRNLIEQVQDSVDCVLWKLIRFSISMKVDQLLPEDFEDLRLDLFILVWFEERQRNKNLSLDVQFQSLCNLL
jgi:hypothetical protein